MSEKRKASALDAEGGTPRSAKRVKAMATANGSTETAESTLEKGTDFIRAIKASKDKTGRSIIDAFLTLPDAKEVPGYYDQIKLPLAMDTIENKLKRLQYPTLTALESDFKRMVQNAKDFNDKRSLIFEDAERVRKGASNWFVRHNPAYSDRNYVAKPTPIPGEGGGANGTPAPTPTVSLKITNKAAPSAASRTPARTPAKSATPAVKKVVHKDEDEEEDDDEDAEGEEEEEEEQEEADAEGEEDAGGGVPPLGDFKGKTFQRAQEQIIEELIDYQDPESELQIFTPFLFLPPRTLTDYYEVIRKPVSLKAVQKQINGKVGRAPPTGVSIFATWDALEDELSYIWRNCREYNEDGSEMYNLAGEFEEICRQRLKLAREQVPGPKATTIKLNMGASKNPTIKLKLGAGKTSVSPAPEGKTPTASARKGSTPGIVVDSDALARQRELVSAATNGARPASSAAGTRNPLAASAAGTLSRSQSASAPIPALRGVSEVITVNGVKAEGASPALSAVRPSSAMLPPSGSRPVSGSPHPQTLPQMANGVNGAAATTTAAPVYQPPPATNNFVQSKLRPAGSSVKSSILPTLSISSHPSLPGTPFTRTIKAHPRLIDQSVTYTVPATKHTFYITPTLPTEVTSRAYRIFVTVDGRRVSPRSVGGVQEGGRERPVYEARLERGGVGRVEVEVLAEKVGGAISREEMEGEREGGVDGAIGNGNGSGSGSGKKTEVERERVVVFIHVMKV